MKTKLKHPCANTCSGYTQGKEDGLAEGRELFNKTACMMSEQAQARGFAEGRLCELEERLADAEKCLRELISAHETNTMTAADWDVARAYFERWRG